MKSKQQILKQLQAQAERQQALRSDRRYEEVIAFLSAKGLLQSNKIKAKYKRGQRIPLRSFLWAAEHLEPRIYEVLPAAIIHFPATISELDRIPEDLSRVITCLESGDAKGGPYRHVDYATIRRWADIPLADRRIRPISEKKIARTFRLKPRTIELIRKKSIELEISDAEFIDRLISGDAFTD